MKQNKLHLAITRGNLLPRNTRILVAVSGGADSTALLHLLLDIAPSMGWHVGVAHLNHGLRGADSAKDEAFVRGLATTHAMPVHVRRVNVARLIAGTGDSIEMAARDARYAFFSAVLKRHHYECVALAHTMDDQAETLLLRLLRGSGLTGLGAMSPALERGGVRLVRPLLGVRKLDLTRYLEQRGIVWREDASNVDPTFVRNRVRSELVPLLEERFNPAIVDTLARTAELLRQDDAALCAQAKEDLRAARKDAFASDLKVNVLRTLSAARRRRVMLLWLIEAGVDAEHLHYDAVERVCVLCESTRGSAEASIQEGVTVRRSYDRLTCDGHSGNTNLEGAGRRRLAVPGETVIPGWGVRVVTRWTTGFERPFGERCGRVPSCTYLSGKAVGRAGLYLRCRQDGDRFAPLGMKGEKKVQDIFVDEKVPRAQRDSVPLLECRGQVAWIPGYRVARYFAVRDQKERSLRVEMARIE